MPKNRIVEVIDMLNEKESLTVKEQVILKFAEELEKYVPNWNAICKNKLYEETADTYEDMTKKIDSLKVRMKGLREAYGYTCRRMGEVCGRSYSYISLIENGKIKRMPKDIGLIADHLGTSVPYLIGLWDEPNLKPDLIQIFFWEYPHSAYREVRKDAEELIGTERLITPVFFGPLPVDKTIAEISSLIGKDARLATAIVKLFRADPSKRKAYTIILEKMVEL